MQWSLTLINGIELTKICWLQHSSHIPPPAFFFAFDLSTHMGFFILPFFSSLLWQRLALFSIRLRSCWNARNITLCMLFRYKTPVLTWQEALASLGPAGPLYRREAGLRVPAFRPLICFSTRQSTNTAHIRRLPARCAEKCCFDAKSRLLSILL